LNNGINEVLDEVVGTESDSIPLISEEVSTDEPDNEQAIDSCPDTYISATTNNSTEDSSSTEPILLEGCASPSQPQPGDTSNNTTNVCDHKSDATLLALNGDDDNDSISDELVPKIETRKPRKSIISSLKNKFSFLL